MSHRHALRVLGALALGVQLVACGADDIWERAAATLPAQIAKAKAIGMPLELKDIGLPKHVPGKDNAAPLYRKAIKAYEAVTPSEMQELLKTLGNGAAAPRPSSAVIASRKRLGPIIKLALAAASRPSCDFQRDWRQGFAVLLPEYAPMKGLVKILSADAVFDAQEGNLALCLSKFKAASRIGGHIGPEPTLIAMLVQIACDAIIAQRVQYVISLEAASPTALAQIDHAIQSFDPLPSLRHALEGEIVIGRISVRAIKSLRELEQLTSGVEEEGVPKPNDLGGLNIEAFPKALEARVLEYWVRAYPAVKSNGPVEIGKSLDRLSMDLESEMDPTYIAAAIIMPVFGQSGIAVAGDQATRLLNEVKIDILQYKLSHGKYPAKLSDLGKVPVDPMDGKPLRYRQTGAGFILYSIGRNLKDDGGVNDPRNGDIVVEHPYDRSKLLPRTSRTTP